MPMPLPQTTGFTNKSSLDPVGECPRRCHPDRLDVVRASMTAMTPHGERAVTPPRATRRRQTPVEVARPPCLPVHGRIPQHHHSRYHVRQRRPLQPAATQIATVCRDRSTHDTGSSPPRPVVMSAQPPPGRDD
jgi:hypothetical protein